MTRSTWAPRRSGGLLRLFIIGAVVGLVASCAPASSMKSYVEFSPTAIDPTIDFGPTARSVAAAPRAGARGRLVVLFAGSGGDPKSLVGLTNELVDAGFHVLGVTYDSSLLTLQACPDAVRTTDPDCHRSFRGEVVFGEGVADPLGSVVDHPGVSVPAANSAMNGVMQQLEYVRTRFPLDRWDQFQQRTDGVCDVLSPTYGVCEPRWDDVTLMGYSQGGGVALYLSKFLPVARVALLSAAFDAFGPSPSPTVAPWIDEGGFASPSARIAQLVHVRDNHVWRQRAVADSLGLQGPETLLRNAGGVFGSNRLSSDYSLTCPLVSSTRYHSATSGGSCTDMKRYRAAFIHLASGS